MEPGGGGGGSEGGEVGRWCRLSVWVGGLVGWGVVCRVPQIWAHGKQFTVCFFARYTANGPFAVCSKICTRQKFGHTANWPFPVVMRIH